MNVLKTIYTQLKADTDITSIVGSGDNCRIFPGIVPQKITNPYIEFDLYNTEPTDTKDGGSKLDTYYIECSCYHKEVMEVITLANNVRGSLDRFSGIDSGNIIDKIIFDSQNGPYFDIEKELFRVDVDLRVRVAVDFGTNNTGSYLFTYIINVNGVQYQTGTFNPLVSNTFNISA